MAGPGKTGPPAKYDEEWEQKFREARVIQLRRLGMTHQEIADEVGLERSTVTKTLQRLAKQMLAGAGAEEVAFVHYQRLEAAFARFYKKRIDPEDPDFTPTRQDLETMVKVSESIRRLVGADAATKLELKPEENTNEGSERAKRLNRFMNLADQILDAGYGSGRRPDDIEPDDADIVDAVVIEDTHDEDEDEDED